MRHRAHRCGYTGIYATAHHFFIALHAARADHSYDRQMLCWPGVELLFLDDLGLRPLHSEFVMDLSEPVLLSYERGALLSAANRQRLRH